MPRFFRATLTVLVLATALITLMRHAQSATLHDTATSLFDSPEGTPCTGPCILGIRPGETTPDEVIPVLHAHPATANPRPVETLRNTYLFTLGGTPTSLAFSIEAGGVINYARLSFVERVETRGHDSLTLGDIIGAFGSPDFVVDYRSAGQKTSRCSILVYLDEGLQVFVSWDTPLEARFRPGYSLSDLIVFRIRACPGSAMDALIRPWGGFTALSNRIEQREIKVFFQTTDRLFPIVCRATHLPT